MDLFLAQMIASEALQFVLLVMYVVSLKRSIDAAATSSAIAAYLAANPRYQGAHSMKMPLTVRVAGAPRGGAATGAGTVGSPGSPSAGGGGSRGGGTGGTGEGAGGVVVGTGNGAVVAGSGGSAGGGRGNLQPPVPDTATKVVEIEIPPTTSADSPQVPRSPLSARAAAAAAATNAAASNAVALDVAAAGSAAITPRANAAGATTAAAVAALAASAAAAQTVSPKSRSKRKDKEGAAAGGPTSPPANVRSADTGARPPPPPAGAAPAARSGEYGFKYFAVRLGLAISVVHAMVCVDPFNRFGVLPFVATAILSSVIEALLTSLFSIWIYYNALAAYKLLKRPLPDALARAIQAVPVIHVVVSVTLHLVSYGTNQFAFTAISYGWVSVLLVAYWALTGMVVRLLSTELQRFVEANTNRNTSKAAMDVSHITSVISLLRKVFVLFTLLGIGGSYVYVSLMVTIASDTDEWTGPPHASYGANGADWELGALFSVILTLLVLTLILHLSWPYPVKGNAKKKSKRHGAAAAAVAAAAGTGQGGSPTNQTNANNTTNGNGTGFGTATNRPPPLTAPTVAPAGPGAGTVAIGNFMIPPTPASGGSSSTSGRRAPLN